MVMLLAAALVARSSHAAELRSTLDTSARWNSNARGAGDESGDQQSDVLLGAAGRFDLHSDPSRFSWRLGYAPAYERFLDQQELDNWRHRGFGSFQYALSPVTEIGGRGEYTTSSRTNVDPVFDDVAPAPEPILEETDERIERGSLTLNLAHQFGPRWSGSTSAGYSFTDYSRDDRSDFTGATASAALRYAMTPRQSLGGGLQYSRQIVDQANLQLGGANVPTDSEQETRYASLFGTWSYQLSPLWHLDTRAGPTFIDSEFSGGEAQPPPVVRVPSVGANPLDGNLCTFFIPAQGGVVANSECEPLQAPLPPGFQSPTVPVRSADLLDGSSTTIFASFGIVRSGERSQFSLSYNRSAGENYGGRTSTVSDVLSSRFTWRPDPDWRLDVRASYSKQQQAASADTFQGFPLTRNAGTVPGIPDDAAIVALRSDGSARLLTSEVDNAFDVDSWSVSLRATRRLTRHLSGFMTLRYLDQTNNGVEGGVADDLDQFEVGLGLSYAFDPIRL